MALKTGRRPIRNVYKSQSGQWCWSVGIDGKHKHPRREQWGDIKQGTASTFLEAVQESWIAFRAMRNDWKIDRGET